jgi:hypothetical protein
MNKVPSLIFAGILSLAAAGCAAAQMRGANRGQFLDNADANKDGVITREEFQRARMATFDKIDRNHDGFLDSDDAPKFRRRASGGNGERLQALKDELDQNGDGRVSREEFANGPMLAFDKADANHDGKLDSAEVDAFKQAVQSAKDARKSAS